MRTFTFFYIALLTGACGDTHEPSLPNYANDHEGPRVRLISPAPGSHQYYDTNHYLDLRGDVLQKIEIMAEVEDSSGIEWVGLTIWVAEGIPECSVGRRKGLMDFQPCRLTDQSVFWLPGSTSTLSHPDLRLYSPPWRWEWAYLC